MSVKFVDRVVENKVVIYATKECAPLQVRQGLNLLEFNYPWRHLEFQMNATLIGNNESKVIFMKIE